MADVNRNRPNGQPVAQGQGQAQGQAQGQGRAEEEGQQGQGINFTEIFRMFVLMMCAQMAFQFIASSFGGGINNIPSSSMNQNNTIPQNMFEATSSDGAQRVPAGVGPNRLPSGSKKKFHLPLWKPNTIMDFDLYINEQKTFRRSDELSKNNILASWHEENLIYGSHASNERNISVSFDISKRMQANETMLYAHLILRRKINRIDNENGQGKVSTIDGIIVEEEKRDILQKTFELTRLKLRKKKRNEKNLLAEEETAKAELFGRLTDLDLEDETVLGKAARNYEDDVYLLYVKPLVDLQLVDFSQPFTHGSFNADAMKMFDFFRYGGSDEEEDDGEDNNVKSQEQTVFVPGTGHPADYYPIVYPSEFWMRDDSLVPVNGTLKNVTIDLQIRSIQMWKFTLMAQFEQQWTLQESMDPGSNDSDFFRGLLLDTNPVLLVVTFIVTLLHTVFDFLAFKNDITFFKGKRSMEGLSVRTMVVNAFFQVVVFLYLFDNETNKMVLMSNGVGLVIEFWKITKAITFSIEGGRLKWRETSSYAKSKTKEYDEIATDHLLFVTLPLVVGYGIYSLVHMKHKSWYSWILSTLVGFIYMFGFVMMTPQLFINYKLQSTAHLNWRTMTYKSINTFIDDLFAFVVKMPIMHRLACLRDDVIFLVFIYQKYKYGTDYTRVNEFGQCEQPSEELLKEVEAEKKAKALQNQPVLVDKVVENAESVIEKNDEDKTIRRRSARDRKK